MTDDEITTTEIEAAPVIEDDDPEDPRVGIANAYGTRGRCSHTLRHRYADPSGCSQCLSAAGIQYRLIRIGADHDFGDALHRAIAPPAPIFRPPAGLIGLREASRIAGMSAFELAAADVALQPRIVIRAARTHRFYRREAVEAWAAMLSQEVAA